MSIVVVLLMLLLWCSHCRYYRREYDRYVDVDVVGVIVMLLRACYLR